MARATFQIPSFRNLSSVLAVSLVVVSVVAALFRDVLLPLLVLSPSDVVGHFYVWQLLTYGLIEVNPGGVIFGAIIIWSIGGALENQWGRARFVRFSVGVIGAAALATVALGFLSATVMRISFAGGQALTASLWVAYGLNVGRNQTNFWGMPVTGNVLALIGAGFVFLSAAFAGSVLPFLPEVLALGFTYLVMRGGAAGGLLTRLRAWQFERSLKKRSAHLKSLDGGRDRSRGSDKYLQ